MRRADQNNTSRASSPPLESEKRPPEPPAINPALTQEIILNQRAEGVIVTDAAGRVILVNQAAAALHGVARLDIAPEAYSRTYVNRLKNRL